MPVNLQKGKRRTMKTKKIIALVLTLALSLSMLFGLAACKNDTKDPTNPANPDGSKTLADAISVQVGGNPETIDPALNSAVDGGNMLITLYETLLIIDQDNNVQSGQAETYDISPTDSHGLSPCVTVLNGQTAPTSTLKTLNMPLSAFVTLSLLLPMQKRFAA